MLTGEDEVSEEESKGVDEIVSHNTGGESAAQSQGIMH